jgi:hypothetical protein
MSCPQLTAEPDPPTAPYVRPPQGGSPPSPYSGSPHPAAPYGLALAVKVIAVAWCVLLLVDCVAAFQAGAVWQAAAARGLAWSQVGVTLYDSTGPLYLIVQVAAYLVGSLWLYRSRQFVDVLSPTFRHTRTTSGIWLAWAFPVVNLWFPYQLVRDIRRGTIGPAATVGPVRVWWLLWLLWMVADLAQWWVVLNGAGEAGPSSELATMTPWCATGAAALGIACGVLWLRLIDDVTSAQRARVAALEQEYGEAPR